MKTEYFIELLVTGSLTILSMSLFFVGIVGTEWMTWLPGSLVNDVNGDMMLPVIFILFPFIYIAGIIVDRLVDVIYDKLWADSLIEEVFGSRHEYTKHITKLFLSSDRLAEAYHYTRKRIRICRSTSFLTALILVAFIIIVLTSRIYSHPSLFVDTTNPNFSIEKFHLVYVVASIFIIISLIITIYISFTAWWGLKKKECERLCMRFQILKDFDVENS